MDKKTETVQLYEIHELVMEKDWLKPDYVPMKNKVYFSSKVAYEIRDQLHLELKLKSEYKYFKHWSISKIDGLLKSSTVGHPATNCFKVVSKEVLTTEQIK